MTLSAGTLTIEAAASETLDVTARPSDAGQYEVDFGPGPFTAPAGCTVDFDAILCPAALITRIVVTGAAGDDRVSVRGAVALTADGGAGDDAFRGGDVADDLKGGAGADDLDGRDGDDRLDGGDGADQLSGAIGADQLHGGAGDDTIDGGEGADTIDGVDGDDLLIGGADADAIAGAAGSDLLDGGDGDDTLDGGDGADTAYAGAGDDRVRGGADADTIDGGVGGDTLCGDTGDDILIGGSGTDLLASGHGDDQLDGDADADRLFGEGGTDELRGGAGTDGLDGGAGNDELDGGAGSDIGDGGDGDDTFVAAFDGDRLSGGAGIDTYDASAIETAVTVDAGAGTATTTRPTGEVLGDAPERVIGTRNADVLRAAPDVASMLIGGDGNDHLTGSRFADTLDGGEGRDAVDYSARTVPQRIAADDTATSGVPGENDVVTASNEILIGGAGTDTLVGGPGPDELVGGDGDDELQDLLDGEFDVLHCGNGKDSAFADRTDSVNADCERWNNGAGLVRSVDPITAALRSPRLAIDHGGRMKVSLVCSREAAQSCRANLKVELRHGRKWRPGAERSVLLTPGRRRAVTIFAQRGYRRLFEVPGRKARARVTITVRDAIGRTARSQSELPLTLPTAARGR